MRVAVVHDWLSESGGAEKVTREFIDLFHADVFALVDFLNPEDRAFILHGKHATTTFIQRLPFARKRFRWLLPIFPWAMSRLDLRTYDLILSSSYAVAKAVRKHPGQVHICYIHTPMRYAWVDEAGYLRDHRYTGFLAWMIKRMLRYLREQDKANSAQVDLFIANSANVAQRVRRFYGRASEVLLPPVDGQVFRSYAGPRSGYLAVARLVPYKRIDRIIEAFSELPHLRLTICGDGPDRARLQALAGPNIRFAGHVPQAELVAHMQHASALVCAAVEDLGCTVLEAQACGTPVIALKAGGYLETVDALHGGRFFDQASVDDIRAAVLAHEAAKSEIAPASLRSSAEPYFRDRFRERLKQLVEQALRHA